MSETSSPGDPDYKGRPFLVRVQFKDGDRADADLDNALDAFGEPATVDDIGDLIDDVAGFLEMPGIPRGAKALAKKLRALVAYEEPEEDDDEP